MALINSAVDLLAEFLPAVASHENQRQPQPVRPRVKTAGLTSSGERCVGAPDRPLRPRRQTTTDRTRTDPTTTACGRAVRVARADPGKSASGSSVRVRPSTAVRALPRGLGLFSRRDAARRDHPRPLEATPPSPFRLKGECKRTRRECSRGPCTATAQARHNNNTRRQPTRQDHDQRDSYGFP